MQQKSNATKATQILNMTEQGPRWIAAIDRSPDADGDFFYAARTTGIYCRPSCPARTPRCEHVRFYTSREEAEKAGFRPCKRCNPAQIPIGKQQTALMASACRLIETSEAMPSLIELAARYGLSPSHFQKMCKRCIGITPKAYAMPQRAKRLRSRLAESSTVTEAIYDPGYQSDSRFYEHSARIVGMQPSAYRSGGTDTWIKFAVGDCRFGAILVAQSTRGICAILLGDDADGLLQELQACFPHAELIGGDAEFEQLVAYVVGFVHSPRGNFDLPLDIQGTAFQQRVWSALRQIPLGQTLSYTELAKRLGMPTAVRAVAAACAANQLAIAIPCHRVVRSDGKLAGYRWKIERKRQLLDAEARMAGENEIKDPDS
jgi:AraC family transcriptional regulator of adaptative response/methylated-DNA-[protein]-cysteine methyltransferase